MELYVWSCFFLASTSILCMAGLVLPGYRDNLLQCVGMFVLMIGCASRTGDIWQRGSVPPDWFMVHAGVGLFAYGVLLKVLLLNWRERRLRIRLASFRLDHLDEYSRRWGDRAAVASRHSRHH